MKNTRTLWRAFSIAAILTTGFALTACENNLSPTNVHNCAQDGCRGEWVVTRPATETEAGEETRTCTECSQTETRPIPPTSGDTGVECEHDDCDCTDCEGTNCNCDTQDTSDYCTHDDCDCTDCDGATCNCDTQDTGDCCTHDGCDWSLPDYVNIVKRPYPV